MLPRFFVPFLSALLGATACTSYTTAGGGSGGGGGGGAGGCSTPDDCPGVDSYCGERTCEASACGFKVLAPAGTSASTQPVGDCKELVCDDTGNVVTQANGSDTQNDGNPCTVDACAGTTPTHDNAPAGTTCGNNLSCDGAGTCLGCELPSDCGANGDCFVWACNNQQCDLQLSSAGAPCSDGPCHVCQGSACVVAAAAQDPGDLCAGADTCNANGICRCGDGVKDGNETDKDCGGNGCDKCSVGKACLGNTDCVSGFCADGVCCGSPCTGNCLACDVDGSIGTCSPVPGGTADAACASGICADAANGGQCSCGDPADCKVGDVCLDPPNGNFSICFTPLPNGQACGNLGSVCASGTCVDGVCCDSDCKDTCHSCSAPGSLGACVPVHNASDPDTCAAPKVCDAQGVCPP